MKSYTLASTLALGVGWGVAMIYNSAVSLWSPDDFRSYDLGIVAFYSFLFVMIANGLFIQWPEKFISRFCRSSNQLTVLTASIIYAIVAFMALFGWLFFAFNLGIVFSGFWILFNDAVIIGLAFGLCFPRFWKHITPQ